MSPCKNLKNIDNPLYQAEAVKLPASNASEGHYEMSYSHSTSQQIVDSGRYEVIKECPSKSSTQDYGELYATPLDGINIGDTLDIQIRGVSAVAKPKVCLKTFSNMLLHNKKQEDYETPADALPQNYEKPTAASLDAEEDAEGYVVHNRLYSTRKLDIYTTIKISVSDIDARTKEMSSAEEYTETPETTPITTSTCHSNFLRPKQQSLAVPQVNHDELYMSMHAPDQSIAVVVAATEKRSDTAAKDSGARSKRTMSDYDLPWKNKI